MLSRHCGAKSNMIKKLLSSKRGEGYVDVAISVVCVAMVIVIALSIFQVISLKTQMDRITEDLIECATYEGSFNDTFDQKVAALKAQYGDFEVEYGTPSGDYYNDRLERVQLGDDMHVKVTIRVSLVGIEKVFPLELDTVRVGKSEKYWQAGM